MLSTLFLLGIFALTFRWFAPKSVWTIAAGIPSVVVAGLFATNFFEPMAQAFARRSGPFGFLGTEADCFLFLVMFLGSAAILCNLMAAFPDPPRLPESFELQARLILASIVSYIVMAITLTACDTSPRMQSIMNLRPNSRPLLGLLAPDVHWLGFVAATADGSLSRSRRTAHSSTEETDEPATMTPGQSIRSLRQRYIPVQIPAHQ